MYPIARSLLFRLDPETTHSMALNAPTRCKVGGIAVYGEPVSDPVELMGLRFPNRAGLAAGLY